MDLISVIIPVYRVEAYLDRCVRSIVDQTYPDLEIILVDDGSPDRCGGMCDAWAARDNRIRVIHKENGGLSDARNAGMDIAAGSYIAFVDSDDWIHPEFVACLYDAVRKHEAGIGACDVRVVHDDAVVFQPVDADSVCRTPEQAIRALTENREFRAVAWNKLYHRSLLEGERFPVGRYHEDEFFTYRILDKAKRLAYVDAPLYCYYQRPGSIMNSASPKRLDTLDAFMERQALFRVRYPELYIGDKIMFCTACVHLYQQALDGRGDVWREVRKRIREYRGKIRFSFSELKGISWKDRIYVVGSGLSLDLFCAFLRAVRRQKG